MIPIYKGVQDDRTLVAVAQDKEDAQTFCDWHNDDPQLQVEFGLDHEPLWFNPDVHVEPVAINNLYTGMRWWCVSVSVNNIQVRPALYPTGDHFNERGCMVYIYARHSWEAVAQGIQRWEGKYGSYIQENAPRSPHIPAVGATVVQNGPPVG